MRNQSVAKNRRKYNVMPCPCCGGTRIKVGPESVFSDSVLCRDCGLRVIVTLDWLQAKVENLAILEEDRQREACQIEAVRRWNTRKGEERRLAKHLIETASMIGDCVSNIRWGLDHDTDDGDQAIDKSADRLENYGRMLRTIASGSTVPTKTTRVVV